MKLNAVETFTIKGGRVIDPETGLDDTCDILIDKGQIADIAPAIIGVGTIIDAAGLIVSPGFIDLHSHGQSLAADRMRAHDGVTTSLELEAGVLPIEQWYQKQHSKRALNYGASVSWIAARKLVLSGVDPLHPSQALDRRWAEAVASDAEIDEMVTILEDALQNGALGIGIPNGYAPGSGVREMVQVCRAAAAHKMPTFTHIAYTATSDPRSTVEGFIRLFGYAAATGAHMHICHLNSSSKTDVDLISQLLRSAQVAGLPITTEAYPFGTASTSIDAQFFLDPQYISQLPKGIEAIQLLRNGHRFSSVEELVSERNRNPAQLVLVNFMDTDNDVEHSRMLDQSILYPGAAIASDAMPWSNADGTLYEAADWPLPSDVTAHPRSSGTFARFLRIWVRERQALSWPDALAKCTIIPAKILELATDAAKNKGRLQIGMDADILVLDPRRVSENASFEHMNKPASGVEYLFVNGSLVIAGGALQTFALPGKPVVGRMK